MIYIITILIYIKEYLIYIQFFIEVNQYNYIGLIPDWTQFCFDLRKHNWIETNCDPIAVFLIFSILKAT